MLIESRARRSQLHPALAALKQRNLHLLLETDDLLAQRRLGDVEPGCRPSEVKLLGDGDEITEVPQLHGQLSYLFRLSLARENHGQAALLGNSVKRVGKARGGRPDHRPASDSREITMLRDRIEEKWIRSFVRVFELCKFKPGDTIAILSETQSRQINVQLAELALLRMGVRLFHIVMPTPPQEVPVPIRSTGASNAVQKLSPVIGALKSSVGVIDLTVEGMLHSVELPEILAGGTRMMMVSDEHPEVLERLAPDPELRPRVEAGVQAMKQAKQMRVTSKAGTDLTIDMTEARVGGGWGYTDSPGTITYWPGGLCACYPRGGGVTGTVVMDAGDVNLTFKRYLENPIAMTIKEDFITKIDGKGTDAELMRSYFDAWGDRNAYASAHLGWGMNDKARWDALTMYDRGDVNGTELRAFAGNFLFSTGANQFANRFTLGHFDLPMRNCTITLDGRTVVDEGRLVGALD